MSPAGKKRFCLLVIVTTNIHDTVKTNPGFNIAHAQSKKMLLTDTRLLCIIFFQTQLAHESLKVRGIQLLNYFFSDKLLVWSTETKTGYMCFVLFLCYTDSTCYVLYRQSSVCCRSLCLATLYRVINKRLIILLHIIRKQV